MQEQLMSWLLIATTCKRASHQMGFDMDQYTTNLYSTYMSIGGYGIELFKSLHLENTIGLMSGSYS